MYSSLSCRQESEPPLKRMKLTRTRQSQSLDAKLRSCSWAADGSHSKTESSQSSGSGSHQELSADLSPQNQQQKELSHLSSLSPSNKPSSPPQPSASTMDAPSSRFSSHCTKLILQRLTAYTIQLRAAQDGVLQRVPWGKPICADQTQPSNSLDPHQPVRRSKRTRDQQEKSLELYCCKGNKKIHAAQEEEENSVDEFMEAADPPPHALQQTARRTNTDLVAPWLGTRKGVKENMLHTTTGLKSCLSTINRTRVRTAVSLCMWHEL